MSNIIRTYALAILVLLFGCTPTAHQSNDIVAPGHPPDADFCDEMIQKSLDAIDSSANELRANDDAMFKHLQSFRNYHQLAKVAKDSKLVRIYEGLPHWFWDSELFDSELENRDTVEFRGFAYYASPIPVSSADAKSLLNLYCTRGTFHPKIAYPACGGYHPDWCIILENNGETLEVELCFGCGEMKTFDQNGELYCVIASDKFSHILEPYHKYRPDK